MAIQKMVVLIVAVLMVTACAGPRETSKGPLYYVTGDVVKVLHGEKDGQVACEQRADIGSHVPENYCYTRDEVIARHEKKVRNQQFRTGNRCWEPSLCME